MYKTIFCVTSLVYLFTMPSISKAKSVESHSINIDASNDLAFFQGKKGAFTASFDGQITQSAFDTCEIKAQFHPTTEAPYLYVTQLQINNASFTFASLISGYGIGDSVRQINNQGQIVYTNTFDQLSLAADMVGCGTTGHASWAAKNRTNYLIIDKDTINIVTSFSCGLIPQKHVRSLVCKY